MNIIQLLLPIALLLASGFLIAFIKGSQSGQFDDLETPAHRILIDDEVQNLTLERKPHEPKQS